MNKLTFLFEDSKANKYRPKQSYPVSNLAFLKTNDVLLLCALFISQVVTRPYSDGSDHRRIQYVPLNSNGYLLPGPWPPQSVVHDKASLGFRQKLPSLLIDP